MVLKPKSQGTGKNQSPSAKKEQPMTSTSVRLSKSPSRTKSPARIKSPARSKNPARNKSPARNGSPARKSSLRSRKDVSPPLQSSTPKIPTPKARTSIRRTSSRKSPTRPATRSAEIYFSEKIQRPGRRQVDIESDSESADLDIPPHVEKPQAAIRGRARLLEVQVEKLNVVASQSSQPTTFNLFKSVTQNPQSREVERIVHLKHFDTVAQKMGEFSDEDDIVHVRKSVSKERGTEFKQITEFGGPWGALFYILIIPISLFVLLISCNESQCSFAKLPDYRKYISMSAYFDLSSLLGFVGYATFLALLSVIPFGGKQVSGMPTKQGKFIYIMNGFFSCVLLVSIGIGLEFKSIPITEFVVKHLFHLLIGSILFGFLLTTYSYVKSFYVPFSSLNAHVVGKNKIYGFFMGRELNPRVFGLLDLKMYVFRLALIGSLLLDLTYLYRSVIWTPFPSNSFDLKSIKINPTLLVLVLIHSVLYLDSLLYETSFVTSFEIQYEGFGYMSCVGYLIYPFMASAVTKYVLDYNISLSTWKLVLTSLVFFFGYILYRGSNNQKDAFRKNPYDPALSHLETIPTCKGKKLICSGFWGVVRHPNYLGDILMNIAFIPFAVNVPPVLSSVSIIVILIHRSVRDNVRCKQKYGAAWDRYCSKVKYVLLPKVY